MRRVLGSPGSLPLPCPSDVLTSHCPTSTEESLLASGPPRSCGHAREDLMRVIQHHRKLDDPFVQDAVALVQRTNRTVSKRAWGIGVRSCRSSSGDCEKAVGGAARGSTTWNLLQRCRAKGLTTSNLLQRCCAR